MPFEAIVSGSVILLKDMSANTLVEIYAYGALLNQFAVQHDGEQVNVVDGFSSPADAKENLTPYFKSAKLSPYVCRVKNAKYTFGKDSHQLSKYASHGNALHGLLYDALFAVTRYESDDSSARVQLEYVYDNAAEGYPFAYKCEVAYKLEAGNALTVTTTVTNTEDQLMPVTDGWHPYFTLGDAIDDYQLEFQSKEMLEFDEDLIPTGKLLPYQEFGSLKDFGPALFDNCFTVNFAECQPLCVVRNPKRKIELRIYPSESYPYLQIYTPPHRKSIAIENLSAAPDAFNNNMGLRVLEANETATFSTKFVIHSL